MLSEYIDLEYTPKQNELLCEYFLEPAAGVTLEKAATNVAGESSIDTWTDIQTLNPQLAETLKPHVYYLDRKTNVIRVAYNCDLFETNSIPQYLSSVAGNIFSMKVLNQLRLQDITFPVSVVQEFKGPKFGLKGVRDILKVYERPLIGTIVKPKVGLETKQHAEVAYHAWAGGGDIVKDDENLTNQRFNRFDDRARQTLHARDKAETETG